MKSQHIKTIYKGRVNSNSGCRQCQTSCQSACKTSCTVGNQECKKDKLNY